MPRPALELSGQRFGLWTVVGRDGKIGEQSAFLCRCDCGTVSRVRGPSLKSGGSTNCGCVPRARLGDRARKHGQHQHHLYGTWRSMRERCNNPLHDTFHRYGGRGITVCPEWDKFEAFLSDMETSWKQGLTLDRIDNSAGYSRANCRWASRVVQASNKEHRHRFLTAFGQSKPLVEWASETGLRPALIRQRLCRGDSDERALRT